jgi:hypothetical protein
MRTTADIATQQNEGISKSAPSLLSALTLPERIPAEWAIVAVVFALATGYSLFFPRFGVVPDEGNILQGTQRVLDGQVPYRDFFSLFTPGSFYFHVLLFRTFGDSIVVARTAVSVYGGLFAALTYLIARRVCARWSALLTSCMLSVAVLPISLFALHNWDSTLWAYLTLYCAVWILQRPHWAWALAMGTCCSMTILFEQSKGAGLLLGLVTGFGLLRACNQIRSERAQLMSAFVGLVLPIAVTISYFAWQRALLQMIVDLIHPLEHFAAVNAVPYGYMYWGDDMRSAILGGSWFRGAVILFLASPYFLVSALPVLGTGVLAYSTVKIWKMRQARVRRWSYYVLVSACTSGLLLSVLATRKDIFHLVYIAPIASLIMCWLLDGGDLRVPMVGPGKPLLVFILIFAFTILGFTQLLSANRLVSRKTRRGVLNMPAEETALDYLAAHTRPGEEIFVYPYGPAYYYLTATSNPTPYDFMQPGSNTPQQFQEALNVIATRRPRVVVFQSLFWEDIRYSFPSTPIQVLASRDPVAEFILREYRPCAVLVPANFGGLVFMVRKESPCAAGSARVPASTNR